MDRPSFHHRDPDSPIHNCPPAEPVVRATNAVRPNPSLKLTRYGMRCKPGVFQSKHRHTPGLQHMPPRAA
jgi:hypothetical protein